MKGMDQLFCASQASTAICMSMGDQPSSSSSSAPTANLLGGKAIDRHNPIIRDSKRTPRISTPTTLPKAPCTASQPPPINPKPYHLLNKTKKPSSLSSSSSSSSSNKENNVAQVKKKAKEVFKKEVAKKVTSFASFDNKSSDNNDKQISFDHYNKKSEKKGTFNVANNGSFSDRFLITPPGSSRYLLGDSVFSYGFSDSNPVESGSGSLVPVQPKRFINTTTSSQASSVQHQSIASKPSSSSSSPSSSVPSDNRPQNQVVVLRVSLHCKGCEGKVRKHLSRMEGVTSFNIDFAAKKVTIVGDVTPLGVLASVSKVKNAQFWPSTASPSLGVGSNKEEINK